MRELPGNPLRLGLHRDQQASETPRAGSGDAATEQKRPISDSFLAAGGEMGALIRAMDWSKTPIGPVETWSQTLRMMVSFLLANRFPLLLWWGPEFVQIYNDAYRPIPGAKHPKSMGQPASQCWSEIWHVIGPLIETPFNGGPATWMEDIPLEINRYGFTEETHFTIAYSPVPDESAPRGIGGVLATVHEITEKVVGERRITILRDLGARAAEGKTAEEACARAAATLANHSKDIPFAILYLIGPEGKVAHLAGAAGVAPGEPVSPREIALEHASDITWPLAEALRREEMIVVEDLAARFAAVPMGPWSDPPRSAVVAPVRSPKAHQLAGLLVLGISPRLKLDELYRSFLDLVSSQIATSIANARAYEEERKRAEALAEIDRAKTAFFSNVSHEFRTPLTLMLGPLSDLLSKPADQLGSDCRTLASLAHRNGLRLLKLVNSLLDFSRIEAGRVEASYEPTDIAALTAELASNFRSACEKAGLTLEVDALPVGEPVYVDRDMWEKIVLNLLSNAFKYTMTGGITVTLRKDGGRVVLSVRDTGVGLPEHELPRLFERFHRVEGAHGRTHEGSGIGLALVQELAKLHGGNVSVESVHGTGSTFHVSVPLGTAHLPYGRIRAPRAHVSTALGAHPYVEEALRWLPEGARGQTEEAIEHPLLPRTDLSAEAESERAMILLADDNADMRDYVRRLLGTRYRVEAVSDGQAALEAIRRRAPDLVVSDVMMPRLDGFALVRALRADPALANLPIVLLSARAGEDASVEGLGTGADDYLVKPFSARELVARVDANLGMARLRRESERSAAAELKALKRLNEIGNRCVRAGDDYGACLTDILDAAIDFTRAEKGNIQLLDATSGVLGIAAQRGFEKPFLDFFQRVEEGEAAACGSAMKSAERVVVEDVTRSEIFVGQASLDVILAAGVRAVQSTPLMSSTGRLLGMISTHYRFPYRPSERELGFMDLLARQAADYLERVQAEAALRATQELLREFNDHLEQKVEERSRALEDTEQRFRLLVEAVADYAIFMLDDTGHVASWNTGAQRIKGYKPEEVVGEHFSLFYPEEARREGVPERALATATRTGRYEAEGWRVRKDGARFWASVVINAIRDADGRLRGFAKVTRDLTERRTAQEQLNQAQKMEAIGQLTGGIAHDFNNLLTVISGNIEALQRRLLEAPEADLRRLASSALRGAERAAILTHRLLAFSRRQALEPKPVSVNTLISTMSEMLRRTLGESITIEIVLAAGVWSTFVDANQLENAVLNLAINARDAMPDGGKLTIEVANAHLDEDYAARAEVAPGQYVGIFVSDTGSGMTPETAAKAFDPFFTTKEVGHGTGLGLSQVYGFVKQSNGHVTIYSEPGAGTTVKLYLPRDLSSVGPSETQSAPLPMPRGAGETILVVDDDADVRSLTVEMLRELGYVVLEAPEGAAGLRLLEAHPEIRLLFTDVGLPGGMNGRQLAEKAKRRRAGLNVLFTSGYARNAIVHHGRLDPGVELLSKPYSFATLAVRVRRLMDAR
jgi:PAS domain S-box-containing protein